MRHDESTEEVVSVSGGLLKVCVGVEGGRKEEERAKSARLRPSLATRVQVDICFDILQVDITTRAFTAALACDHAWRRTRYVSPISD